MEIYNYKPHGVCATNIRLEIEGDTLVDIVVTGGCPGNLLGIKSLVQGMKLKEVAKKLEGIKCGMKNTSCPDQIASAIHAYLEVGIK